MIRVILYVKWVWFMGVAYNIRRGFGVGLLVPETSFEKLGPMCIHSERVCIILFTPLHNNDIIQ